MKRLAIVSSYNENCGNASYTHVLKKAFSEHFDVEVLSLDLFLIQKSAPKFGDAHIKGIAEKLKSFDYVNIQFEAGLYGRSHKSILRRIGWLIEASPNLVLTMHRIDAPGTTAGSILAEIVNHRSINRALHLLRVRRWSILYKQIVDMCASQSRKKNVWIKVHTRRERRIVREIFGFENVIDFPLSFLSPEERAALRVSPLDQRGFRAKYGFPETAKVVGVFGFVSGYKGLETAVRALAELPPEYQLGIFGSQHPQTIRDQTEIDGYLGSLINFIKREGEGRDPDGSSILLRRGVSKKKELDGDIRRNTFDSAADLRSGGLTPRIKFVGSLPDEAFIEALRCCDAVVLPYLEVGQSMSGVIALAAEVGAKMFCANNLSFIEVRRYYGDVFHTFDIGNYLELSQKIDLGGSRFSDARDAVFQRFNIKTSIDAHMTCFESASKTA
jgi:glycosyltransferase involved in cell wall biosynthesis